MFFFNDYNDIQAGGGGARWGGGGEEKQNNLTPSDF